jgi:diaminopimelate epimerase
MRFTKGHGTGNDFVIVDETVELSPKLVAVLCDRRFGVGGDGVLRVAREGDLFFMDYWNSDGSIAEMCGNGVRVFARYLQERGLVTGGRISIATRDGVRDAFFDGNHIQDDIRDDIRVDMRPPRRLGRSWARVAGTTYDGVAISMGNPHLVCEVDGVGAVDLSVPPGFDEEFFPEGVNVSFFERAGDRHVRMRVYERGSGETLSCGTGAVAVGVTALGFHPGSTTVDVPGGRLTVTLDEQTSWLAGPAVITYSGTTTDALPSSAIDF